MRGSLILAVEPDSGQAAQLASMFRRQLDAELIVDARTAAALGQLAGRVPDLVLTSPLLSPRDEADLIAWLRELGARASHVQNVTIPVLARASAPAESRNGATPAGRGRHTAATPDSCDPAVFADWITFYLDLAQAHRDRRSGTVTAS